MAVTKQAVREEVWSQLRASAVARFPGVEGRIPNFVGAERAAARLAATAEWQRARVVKANPDSPQWPVRTRALEAGKVVYMAVPRLREPRPFWRLDPATLSVPPRRACSIKGASVHGEPVGLDEMSPVDLVVCGSVAVDRDGARLGKGGGYSDLEFALAVEAGLIGGWTTVATTVHPLQVVAAGRIPVTAYDFTLDLIITPDEVLPAAPRLPPPEGILWDWLTEEQIAAIPALRAWRRD